MTCSAVLNWISGEDGFKDCCNSVCISWCTASISDYHGFDYLRKNMNGIIHLLVLKLYFNWVVLLFNWAWNNTKMCEAKFSRRGFGSPSWGHNGFRPTLTASVIIKEPIVNVMNSLLQLSFTSLCEEKRLEQDILVLLVFILLSVIQILAQGKAFLAKLVQTNENKRQTFSFNSTFFL